jgi:signal transduction histidine kinase
MDLDRIRTMRADERFLSDAARVLASSLDYNKTLKTVARLAVPRLADWAAINLLEDGVLRTVEVAHSDPAKLTTVRRLQERYLPRAGNELGAARVIRTGEAELYPEVTDEMLRKVTHDDEHFETMRALNIKSGMVVPLSAGGQTFGALTFASGTPRRFGSADLRFAQDIGRHMALAIQNARLYTSAERAIRARDEVLRVVSHDLRNPVNNIHMTGRMLESGSLPESKRQEMIAIINRAAERMNRLIEDLVSVARLREGQAIALKVQVENPIHVIKEACQVFTMQARARSIQLVCDTSRPVPMVRADRHRILQVISNLLDNALKFTPEGGRISVSCEAVEGNVRFSVSDTGRGIAREHLTRVFDLFWQASNTAHMGAGFGLAIAKVIIEGHGGRIWAESRPGFGTTFFFTVPTAEGKEDVAEEQLAG